MKITISSGDSRSVSWEQPDEPTCADAVEAFKGLLVAYGYHPMNVDELINSDDCFSWELFKDEPSLQEEIAEK